MGSSIGMTRRSRGARVLVATVGLAASGLVAGMALTGGSAAAGDESRPAASRGGWASVLTKVEPARGGGGGGTTIVLRSKELREAEIDVDGDGRFDPGDGFVIEERLRYVTTDRKAGRDAVACTGLFRSFSCDATLQLKGRGKLTVSGAVFFGQDNFTLAVTGGTQEFRDASGTFKLTNRAGTRFRIDLVG